MLLENLQVHIIGGDEAQKKFVNNLQDIDVMIGIGHRNDCT